MEGSDRELIKRAKAGGHDALAALLERHGPAARRAVAGRIGARWRSVLTEDDIMQQTYLDAALNIDRFEPRGEGSFPAWLSALARYNLLDALKALEAEKRGGDRRRIEIAAAGDSHTALYARLAMTRTTPSRVAARDEAREALDRALGRLPTAYRQVISMYDLEGRPIDAVAGELGRTHGAVFMLRARAHDRLREIMGSASRYLTDA